jgi:hypothetical protein
MLYRYSGSQNRHPRVISLDFKGIEYSTPTQRLHPRDFLGIVVVG